MNVLFSNYRYMFVSAKVRNSKGKVKERGRGISAKLNFSGFFVIFRFI